MPDEESEPAVSESAAEPTADSPPPTTASPPALPVEPIRAEPIAAPDPDTGYTSAGVPTFDSVREKIETRYGTSLGAAELDAETPEGRGVEEQYDTRQRAAAKRLDEIRESMRRDDS
jgi:hypothetical protein